MISIKSFFLFFFLLQCLTIGFSQDTLYTIEEEDSIVLIKNPVVVKKTYYVEETSTNENKKKKIWLEVGGGLIFTNYHYTTCPNCVTYTDLIKSTNTPKTGYTVGVNIKYFLKNISFATGLNYISYKEYFNYSSSNGVFSSNNHFNYLSLPISIGYRFFNKSKFNLIPSIGTSIEKLLTINGLTIDENDIQSTIDITKIRNYYSLNYLGLYNISFVYKINETIGFSIVPQVVIDYNSIVKSKEPFGLKRNNIGLLANLFLMY